MTTREGNCWRTEWRGKRDKSEDLSVLLGMYLYYVHEGPCTAIYIRHVNKGRHVITTRMSHSGLS